MRSKRTRSSSERASIVFSSAWLGTLLTAFFSRSSSCAHGARASVTADEELSPDVVSHAHHALLRILC